MLMGLWCLQYPFELQPSMYGFQHAPVSLLAFCIHDPPAGRAASALASWCVLLPGVCKHAAVAQVGNS